MDHNKVPIIPKQTVNSIFEPVAKNHYKASNYCTLRHMGLKVAKKKKKFNKLQTWTPSSVETRAEPPILPLWVLWVL